jgi:hypothetical protein
VKKADNSKNLKPFKPGPDPRRNLKGPPTKLPGLDELLDRVLGENNGDETEMETIIKALLKKASKGDVRAAEVLLDRAYGKVKQSIDVTSKGQKMGTVPIITIQNPNGAE